VTGARPAAWKTISPPAMIQFVADLRENQLALVYGQSRNHNEFCPSYFEGAYNPLIRRYFLGVFRFAQMALADVRTLTYAQVRGIKSYTESTARRLSRWPGQAKCFRDRRPAKLPPVCPARAGVRRQ